MHVKSRPLVWGSSVVVQVVVIPSIKFQRCVVMVSQQLNSFVVVQLVEILAIIVICRDKPVSRVIGRTGLNIRPTVVGPFCKVQVCGTVTREVGHLAEGDVQDDVVRRQGPCVPPRRQVRQMKLFDTE